MIVGEIDLGAEVKNATEQAAEMPIETEAETNVKKIGIDQGIIVIMVKAAFHFNPI